MDDDAKVGLPMLALTQKMLEAIKSYKNYKYWQFLITFVNLCFQKTKKKYVYFYIANEVIKVKLK